MRQRMGLMYFPLRCLVTNASIVLLIRKDFARDVIDNDRGLKVGDAWFRAILFTNERPPFLGVHGVRFGARVPQIDAANRAAVFGPEVVLANQAGSAAILWRRAQEGAARLFPRDRLGQLKGGDGCNHWVVSPWIDMADTFSATLRFRSTHPIVLFVITIIIEPISPMAVSRSEKKGAMLAYSSPSIPAMSL